MPGTPPRLPGTRAEAGGLTHCLPNSAGSQLDLEEMETPYSQMRKMRPQAVGFRGSVPLPTQSFHTKASLRETPGRSAAPNVTSVMSPLLQALPPPPPERGWEATAGQGSTGRVGPARLRAPLHVAVYFRPRLPASQRISRG